jgi:hypothetical protein
MRSPGLRRSSDELVAKAIKQPHLVIRVAPKLRQRPPCESSARRVNEALREQRLDPWEAALLLSSIGHPVCFEIVCEIFADPRLSYAGSYLASALLDLAPRRAPAQLIRFVEHAATRTGRDEAVWGLAKLGPTPARRKALLQASATGRVSPVVAAPVLVAWDIEPATVGKWLTSGERSEADIACGVVAIAAWRPTTGSGSCPWTEEERARLLQLAQLAVARGYADPKPYVRTALSRPTRHWLLRASVSRD